MASTKTKARADAANATARRAAAKVRDQADEIHGPSPNPRTNLILADIALRGGSMLVRRGVERGLLGRKYDSKKAKAILKGRGLGETLLHTVIARVATRSVPGAIVVGGGLLAKTLYDRRRANQAKAEGEAALEDMAQEGEEQES